MLMIRSLLPVFLTFAAVAADDAPWRSKQIADWNEDDAKQVLTESPWVKTFTPTLKASSVSDGGRRYGGRPGGIGAGGIGLGIPGIGKPGWVEFIRAAADTRAEMAIALRAEPQKVTLRWESALPVRTAGTEDP